MPCYARRADYVVDCLAELQESDGYLSAFPQAEFAQTEDFSSPHPAVPYYVMHKLLAGLLCHHELWASAKALQAMAWHGISMAWHSTA
jgi:DUF1680 family protein